MSNGWGDMKNVHEKDESGQAIAFESYGLRIGIWACDASLIELAMPWLPPGWVAIDPINLDRQYRIEYRGDSGEPRLPPGYWILADDVFKAWAHSQGTIVNTLESLLQLYVAEFAKPYLFLHAGVVVWNGAAILLPGSSMAGKSTLVAALIEAGATYYSDEYAVLDENGRVLPYPRPISLREGPLGPESRLRPDIGMPAERERQSVPVCLVLLTRFRPDAGWRCERLGLAAGIMAMCEHTVAIQSRPADSMRVLGKVANEAAIYQGVRGDLESAVNWILGCANQTRHAND